MKNIEENIKPGDYVEFKAIFSKLGNEWSFHEMKLVLTVGTGESMRVEDIPMI